jgi:flagellar hook-associated protein 1 FlgK
MVSPTNTLFVAHSAIRASQAGIHTVGENISNVNTPGYHRRVLRQTTSPPRMEGGYSIGQGVEILGAQRIIDESINGRRRGAISGSEAATVRSEVLLRAEGIFGDLDGLGVSGALDQLFASFDFLAGQPESSLARSQVLQSAENFARELSSQGSDLRFVREDLNGVVNDQVDAVNQLLGELASLNGRIRSVHSPPNDLLDRREALLDELAKHI